MIGGSTPRRLEEISALYRQLGGLLAAGSGLHDALRTVQAAPPSRTFRTPLARLMHALENGARFKEALEQLGGRVPDLDLALVHAGETSGTLDRTVHLLADFYQERSRGARTLFAELAYPAAILHLAIILFPLERLTDMLWQGEVWGYLGSKVVMFGSLYGGALLIFFATGTHRPPAVRARIERVLNRIPLIESIRRPFVGARVSAALAMLLKAGVSPGQGWTVAGLASGVPSLADAAGRAAEQMQAGRAPSTVIADLPGMPLDFVRRYATAEATGTLDEALAQMTQEYRAVASIRLTQVARWVPRLIYLMALLAVAYRMITTSSLGTLASSAVGEVLAR